jgi:hypothetical protein
MQEIISEPTFTPEVTTIVASGKNELMHRLASLASGRNEPAVDGPIGVGSIARMPEPAVLASVAAHYWNSFDSVSRPYPYFTE